MAYTKNTADIINLILQGSANVESIIRTNSLDQMTAPAANLSMNSKRLITMGQGILSTDAPSLGQLADNQYAYIVSGCVWTADSSGSTLNGSMTSGTVMIKGILLTVAAVTAHGFTASQDTYVDLTDNGDGTAAITYSAVGNNAMSPALAGGATAYTTIRCAIIVSTGSALTTGNNTINQGDPLVSTPGTSAATSTVAVGSNGNNITSATMAVAANSLAAAGLVKVVTTNGSTGFEAVIAYTSGGGTTTLSGITVLSGSGTVATGGAITQVAAWSVSDGLGNLIFCTSPRPNLLTYAIKPTGAITTAITTPNPIAALTRRYIIPAGPSRRIKSWGHFNFLGSSATAGTAYSALVGNGVFTATSTASVAVASDGTSLHPEAAAIAPPGTYVLTVNCNEGAAGTLTVDTAFTSSIGAVELIG